MGVRRKGREIALQALYRMEITGDESAAGLDVLWEHFEAPIEARSFATDLIRGVIAERGRIDELLAGALENWSLGRLSRVDVNVLRIGAYELIAGTPTPIVLNEAIEIARRYGSDDSSQFVNGILDHVAGALGVRENAVGPTAEKEP